MPGNIPEGLTGFDQLPRTATPAPLPDARRRDRAAARRRAGLRRDDPRAHGDRSRCWSLRCSRRDVTDADAEPRSRSRRGTSCCCPATTTATSARSTRRSRTMPETGWFVLVKDAAGVVPRSHSRHARDSGPRSCASSSARRSTTARRCSRRSGSSTTSNLPRTALRPGPVVEVPLRRRALVPVNGRTLRAHARRDAVHAHGEQRAQGTRRRALRDRAPRRRATSTCSTASAGTARSSTRATSTATACPTSSSTSTATTRGTWYVLLSSEAKPGMNAPTAKLTAHGC